MKKLCSNCFKNAGIRQLASSFGLNDFGSCESCGNILGKNVNEEAAAKIIDEYIIEGGRPSTIMPSMFAHLRGVYDPKEVLFFIDNESIIDVAKLSKISEFDIHLNSPKTTHVGETYYGYEFRQLLNDRHNTPNYTKQLIQLIDDVMEYYEDTLIDEGTQIFRIRVNPKNPELNVDFDTPPFIFRKSNNRLNDIDFPVFYGAFDIETCIYESKFDSEDDLYYIELSTSRPIRVFDLTNIKPMHNEAYKEYYMYEEMLYFTHFVFNTNDYMQFTKLLSRRIFEKGYEGILYPSYFSRFRKSKFNNIALFGEPISSGLLNYISKGRIIIKQIQYEYSFGPVINLNELNKDITPFSSSAQTPSDS